MSMSPRHPTKKKEKRKPLYSKKMSTHLAAVALAKGKPFELQTRPTPKPGPGELLIEIKSVALNPADGIMRDQGLFIPSYPTVIGFDISGLVVDVGDSVPDSLFQPGITRVAAYAAFLWKSCNPDYGAFQEMCLVPWQHAAPLPYKGISWNETATLPVAIEVPLSAWEVMGISPSSFSSSCTAITSGGTCKNKKQKNQALLIWGASSSVGTMGVQTARLLREDPDSPFAAVYTTAGMSNQTYIKSLGADLVFDYKEPQVVDAIISAARKDGLVIQHCFLATGQLAPCQAVLRAFLEQNYQKKKVNKAKIASAPVIPPDAEEVNGVETTLVMPSANERERLAQFRYWMGTFLVEHLTKRAIQPSPELKVVERGLEAINAGLDELLRGVSCTKLVVEVAK
ncbi:hypothetical protein PISL3812_06806 [Talaromyces islandicus]|uniref:Enoyl reductase (ER) domain-containing protein n=1 Tax=Talaromyces islandicus TaxID=28573 RepID=A0A0U1M2F2_TALIS|nr:hypothetical protein PISL3812_06806 [Talaromyces islandicus]